MEGEEEEQEEKVKGEKEEKISSKAKDGYKLICRCRRKRNNDCFL